MIFIEIILALAVVVASLDLIFIWVDYISTRRFLKKRKKILSESKRL